MQERRFARAAIALGTTTLLACVVPACTDDDVILPVRTGTLLQRWTIDGRDDHEQCTRFALSRMRLVVLDTSGEVEATDLAPCGTFQTRMVLPADDYTATLTFVNEAGFSESDSLGVERFTVPADETIAQSVDFPVDSIRPP